MRTMLVGGAVGRRGSWTLRTCGYPPSIDGCIFPEVLPHSAKRAGGWLSSCTTRVLRARIKSA